MFLIVGLGNPGEEYEHTRHNAGFDTVDKIAAEIGVRYWKNECGALTGKGAYHDIDVVLAKPQSYMNTSGGPVKALLDYFDVEPTNLIVVHDELDLPFGTLKLKRGGGEGGHNGLKSISQSLGNKNYIRLRFGMGRPPGRQDPADEVLRAFSSAERKDLPVLLEQAADAVEDVLANGLEKATMRLHTAG